MRRAISGVDPKSLSPVMMRAGQTTREKRLPQTVVKANTVNQDHGQAVARVQVISGHFPLLV